MNASHDRIMIKLRIDIVKLPNMPRRKLYKDSDYIQIVIAKEDKIAFDAWCEANSTTMSDIIRSEIASYVDKGKTLMLAKKLQEKGAIA
jgi:hypothetical protein